jgi:hypothetical protein
MAGNRTSQPTRRASVPSSPQDGDCSGPWLASRNFKGGKIGKPAAGTRSTGGSLNQDFSEFLRGIRLTIGISLMTIGAFSLP